MCYGYGLLSDFFFIFLRNYPDAISMNANDPIRNIITP